MRKKLPTRSRELVATSAILVATLLLVLVG